MVRGCLAKCPDPDTSGTGRYGDGPPLLLLGRDRVHLSVQVVRLPPQLPMQHREKCTDRRLRLGKFESLTHLVLTHVASDQGQEFPSPSCREVDPRGHLAHRCRPCVKCQRPSTSLEECVGNRERIISVIWNLPQNLCVRYKSLLRRR